MEKSQPITKRAGVVKNLSLPPGAVANPPADLTAQQLADLIDKSKLKLNGDIPGKVKDLLASLEKTVVISPARPFVERGQGEISLVFIQPYIVDSFDSLAFWLDGNISQTSRHLPRNLSLLLSPGKKMTVDFSVKSGSADDYFHITTNFAGVESEITIKGTGSGQHLTFVVDATQDGIYTIDVENRDKEKDASKFQLWTFFKCTIVELD